MQRYRQRARVVDGQAAGQVVVAAEPHTEWIGAPTTSADLLDDLDENPQPLVEGPTVGVDAPVRLGRQELRDEVAVRAVDLDAVVSSRLEVRGGRSEPIDDHADVGQAHLVRHARIALVRDRRRAHGHEVRLAAGRLATEMDQLAEHGGSVPVDRVGAEPESRDTVGVPSLRDYPRWEARRRVNDRCAGDDQPDPAARSLLLEGDLAGCDLAHVD